MWRFNSASWVQGRPAAETAVGQGEADARERRKRDKSLNTVLDAEGSKSWVSSASLSFFFFFFLETLQGQNVTMGPVKGREKGSREGETPPWIKVIAMSIGFLVDFLFLLLVLLAFLE